MINMKKIVIICITVLLGVLAHGQSNNPLSIYESQQIAAVGFEFKNLPVDTVVAKALTQRVKNVFSIYPQTQYNSLMSSYYVSQVRLIRAVASATLDLTNPTDGGVVLTLQVTLNPDQSTTSTGIRSESLFRDLSAFPVVYSGARSFLTMKAAAAQMFYSNNNAWFAQPGPITEGNPLATNPVGGGYTGWIDGFASVGVYGLFNLVPSINLHVYGGVNYLVSYSAGEELFTNASRFYGDVEEAYVGFVGGSRTARGHNYRYNLTYGRKQFTLGDGFLIINTSMNGDNRAALQLNPRWASRSLFQAGFSWDRLSLQVFRMEPDELPILNSGTVIQGVNLELGNRDRMLLGASFLHVPTSRFKYYMPDGSVHTRQGLQVYNLRLFRSAPSGVGGLFFKGEVAYERNSNFDMSALAFYGELGWNFAHSRTSPSISYRFAYFSGDNADSKSYNRWDALYTGGTGEQWVQGSNMYKMVQNSNEISHRLQVVLRPAAKLQFVGQLWAFSAPQLMNLGGNPALSVLKSNYYGSEINLTLKYFYSRNWYFHLNTAYTVAGGAITNNVPGTKNWFCLSVFARYSF